LNRLEQTRHVLGELLGRPDLGAPWAIRIVIPKKPLASSAIVFGRAGWIGAVAAPDEAARILIESNIGRMPPGIDEGLIALLSTLEADGPRLKLGQPPPPDQRTREWALMHMLATQEQYSRLRVLLSNLAKGVDSGPAFRNALGQEQAVVMKQAEAYLAVGSFTTLETSGKAINPERQFYARPVEHGPFVAEVSPDPRAAYTALLNQEQYVMEAHEGLGLLAVEAGDQDAARRHFEAAVKLGSQNPRVYAGLGDWRKAAELNAKWAEPAYRLAQAESDPGRKVHLLKAATSLAIRNAQYWIALAEAHQSANQFTEASRAWAAAEQAARDEKALGEIRQARAEIEQRRADFEAAEKRRIAEEKQREIERLKAEAMSRIRAAETKAKEGIDPLSPETKVVPWFETDQGAGRIEGMLERIECLRGTARLVISGAGKKQTRLLVKDTKQIVIAGGGEQTLACGVQRPPRKVKVEFNPRKDAKALTEGDAQLIEFQ
jgi:tetratricopeptide (TPR) repeat protein